MSPRLDSPVNLDQPASDWAKAMEAALDNPPATTGHDSTLAKPQDSTQSAVSTPGTQVPGAWTDKPVSGQQMFNDASATLASMGNAAYNALPGSLKGAFSNQTTNKPPAQITMTTPAHHIAEVNVHPQPGATDEKIASPSASNVQTHNEPTYTDTAAAETVADKTPPESEPAQDNVSPISKVESNIIPQHQAPPPQSQDEQGGLAYSRPAGDIDTVPSPVAEDVTISSNEKGHSGPITDARSSLSRGSKGNTAPAEPYNPPRSELGEQAVQRPKSTASDTPNKSENTDFAKEAPNKLPTSDAASGDVSSGDATKKSGFIHKLRVRSKIITSKLSNKPDKVVAQGQHSTHA